MVNKETIKKIIHEAYTKCSNNHIPPNTYSWGVRLPTKVKQAIQQFKETYCTMGKQSRIEHMELYDNNGNKLYDNEGDEDKVEWSVLIASDIREDTNTELHMVHNHPNGLFGIPTCFSKADINSFLRKSLVDKNKFLFKSSSVVTANGSRMTSTKNNKVTDDNIQDCFNTYDKLSTIYEDYIDDIAKSVVKTQQQFKDGELDTSNILQKNGLTNDQNIEYFIMNHVVKDVGTMESRLSGIREEFNKANIEFSIEWEGEQY